MATITKTDLIERITNESHLKRQDVKLIVQRFLGLMIQELGAGNRLEFRDFGIFEAVDRAPRVAQNPKTLERVPVPPRKCVKFKSGRFMKDVIDGKTDPQSYSFEMADGEYDK